jgi:hypothetical protein
MSTVCTVQYFHSYVLSSFDGVVFISAKSFLFTVLASLFFSFLHQQWGTVCTENALTAGFDGLIILDNLGMSLSTPCAANRGLCCTVVRAGMIACCANALS